MKHTLAALFLATSLLHAQSPDAPVRGVPAATGLQRLEDKFGIDSVDRVFEMTGVAGDPQPLEWRVTAHDPGQKGLLHEFWIGERRVTDEGLNDDFYPDRIPKGFFRLARLKIDSTQAFAIVEQIARDSGVGFDAINYKAHCREYSDEPVWTLTLLDKEEEIVGSVHLSGESGTILRTIWIRRKPNGRLIVEDSALTGKPQVTKSRVSAEAAAEATQKEPAPPTPDEPAPAPAPEMKPEPKPPTPAPAPKVLPPADGEQDVPEIQKLNEAQEKVVPKKP